MDYKDIKLNLIKSDNYRTNCETYIYNLLGLYNDQMEQAIKYLLQNCGYDNLNSIKDYIDLLINEAKGECYVSLQNR